MTPAIPASSAAKPRRAKSQFKSGLQAGATPSTKIRRRSSADADQRAAAIVRDRFGRERAVGLDPHGIKHLEFGNHIGRHRILLRMFDKRQQGYPWPLSNPRRSVGLG